MTSSRLTLIFSCALIVALTLLHAPALAADPSKPYIKNLREVINSKHYPQKLKDNPIEGKVVVSIWLDEDGNILKYKVDESNSEELAKFITGRVPLLEFEPARDKFGARVFSKVKLPFEFKKDI